MSDVVSLNDVLGTLNRYGIAAQDRRFLQAAFKLFPAWETLCNEAHLLDTLGKFATAEKLARKAVELSQGKAFEPWFNLGTILAHRKKYVEAVGCFRQTLAIQDDVTCHFTLGCTLLTLEQWREGWKEYEYRLRFEVSEKAQKFMMRFAAPQWQRSDTHVPCVVNEQGFGDLFMGVRWLNQLPNKTIVEVPKGAVGLLQANFPEMEIIARQEPGPECERVVSVMSLPYILQIEDVSSKPYIAPPRKKLKLPGRGKVKIGICWSGNAGYVSNARRSCPLSRFSALVESNVQLYSLVKEPRLTEGATVPMIDLGPWLEDWSVTAGVLDQLDMIVSVDTGLAHLSGAMGLRTYVLLPFVSEWRWGQGVLTPWYDSVRLIRQTKWESWDSVFDAVQLIL